MIYEVCVELRAYLAEQGCPFPIVEGAAADPTTLGPCFITIERDEAGESFGPPRGARAMNNPKPITTRKIGVLITFRIQRTAGGALPHEHARICDHVVDLVLAGLAYVSAVRRIICSLKGGKYITPPDMQKSEATSGVVYELRFDIDRAVVEQQYDRRGAVGEFRSTTTIGAIGAQTLILDALVTESGQSITTESGSVLTLES
jgi:hypothetical protein